MISIIIPLFNKEKQLKLTIESVLNQSFQDFEIIVVNDGSTDNSLRVLNSFSDKRIRLIEQRNQGVSVARNRGVAAANYDYIAFLDADDEWTIDYLKAQYNLITCYPECSVFACAYQFRDSLGRTTPLILNKLPFKEEKGILSNYFEVASCSHPPLCASSVVVKKESLLSVGGFPAGIKSGEDLLTWARLAVKDTIAFSRKSGVYYSFDFDEFNKNPRILDAEDIVGSELVKLYENNPGISGLREYVAFWFKTRVSILLRYAHWTSIWKNSGKAIQYCPINFRIYIYLLVALLPTKYRLKLLNYSSINSR